MWEQIKSNQFRTVLLLVLLGLLFLAFGFFLGLFVFIAAAMAVLAIVISILATMDSDGDLAIVFLVGLFAFAGFILDQVKFVLLQTTVAGMLVMLGVWAVMTLVAYVTGDKILLKTSGAKLTGHNDYPQLHNIVEEMTIASGLPAKPAVYVIDDHSLNSFATGRDINRSAVTVTTGLLEKLKRDELQGVIGHEIAHIMNRDVLLTGMCSVVVAAEVRVYKFVGRCTSRNKNDSIFWACLNVVGKLILSPMRLATTLAFFSVSRRREYLADACSALYTRYPDGLAAALEKIDQSGDTDVAVNPAMRSMYLYVPSDGGFWDRLFTTHPSTMDRIRILRAMCGNYSLEDYDKAYLAIKKTKTGIFKIPV